jgi:3-dehydroquinate synthase class II
MSDGKPLVGEDGKPVAIVELGGEEKVRIFALYAAKHTGQTVALRNTPLARTREVEVGREL